ncbi:hypothetical protein JKP88DRAFT_247611 [Tribonema minus]|uniref:Uncharacterized protein n=1 Tax=Tribonema minus TaxID=303371 RepID=A0A835YPK7_9STRA|nr:hypothetical protein JKP88DRAFT_247611 [Tribonema minus]
MTKAARKTAEETKKQSRLCNKAKKPDKPSEKRKNLTFEDLKRASIDWGHSIDNGDDKQRKHIQVQGKCMSKCTMLLADGSVTPTYNNIQSGHTSPPNMPMEVVQARKEAGNAKRSVTHKARGLGQTHHLEQTTFEALLDVTSLRGVLEYPWAPDGVSVDVALRCADTAADAYCPCQLKASDTTDGGQFDFNLSKSNMLTKYAGRLIVAIGYKQGDDDQLSITQVFVLSHADDMPGKSLCPMVHPQRKDAFANNRFRMDDDEQRKLCRERILEGMRKVPHHTLYETFFSLEVNRNVSKNHKMELIGLKHIYNALPTNTTMTLASDKNKTVDFHIHRAEISLGISAKTASLDHKKPDGTSSGFWFEKGAAPDHHKCDWVLVVYLDKSRTIVEGFSAIKGSAVYTDDKGETFGWHKSGCKQGVHYTICKYKAWELVKAIDIMLKPGGQS